MEGVIIHLIIGGTVFTAFGFIYALIQDKKEKEDER